MINKRINQYIWLLCITLLLNAVSVSAGLKQKKERNTISQRLSKTKGDKETFTNIPTPIAVVPEAVSSAVIKDVQEAAFPPVKVDNSPFAFTNNSADIPLELRSEIKSPDDEMADALGILNARQEESIEFNFENASLEMLINQIEKIFDLTFIVDDIINPMKKDSKEVKGHKITFKTHKPLNKKQAWSLFTTFLDIAQMALVPLEDKKMYRIQTVKQAQTSTVPVFIGVDPEQLPPTDEIIRYVYFIKNSTLESISKVVNALRSPEARMVELREHKAFLLVDKSYNIRVLMQIVKELDQTTRPQSMSVLRLQRADAQQVKNLYESLINPDQKVKTHVFKPQQKPSSLYFPEDMKIIAEPRTNTLILLGPGDAIKKVEQFILKYVDVDIAQPYSPLNVIQLKYADAGAIADIMREVTRFGERTPAGINGGVRGGDKYLKPIKFIPDTTTNRIIVRGDYEDFLAVKTIIEKLDEQQPQVAIEILILNVTDIDTKQLGTALRSKVPGGTDSLLGNKVQFQTSGLFAGNLVGQGIVENSSAPVGAQKLLGNLLNLVTQAGPGNSIVSLGRDIFGVWGIFQMLKTVSNLHVISNPFITATNKTPATVSLGTTRRVVTSVVQGTTPISAQGDDTAALRVDITPQINSDGMISLDFTVDITQFTNASNPSDGTKSTQKIKSKAIVADQEVLALGGLIKTQLRTDATETPLLGKIPLLGWLFKNKSKIEEEQHLLILVAARIIPHDEQKAGVLNRMTESHYREYRDSINNITTPAERRDPIHRAFFSQTKTEKKIEEFIFDQGKKNNKYKAKKRKQRELRKVKAQQRVVERAQKRKEKEETQSKGGMVTPMPIQEHKAEIGKPLDDAKPLMVKQDNKKTEESPALAREVMS